jgi:hypothetical protein
MVLRFGLICAVLGCLTVTIGGVSRAAADPTYDLVETACYSGNGGCVGFTLPVTIGTISGSGTYFNSYDPPLPFSASGDLSVSFSNYFFDSSNPSPPNCAAHCSVDINLTDNTGYLNFEDFVSDPFIRLNFDGTTFSGEWGSDGYLSGCGSFASCYISGVLDPVPEPSSLPMLLAGLAAMSGALYLARKKAMMISRR